MYETGYSNDAKPWNVYRLSQESKWNQCISTNIKLSSLKVSLHIGHSMKDIFEIQSGGSPSLTLQYQATLWWPPPDRIVRYLNKQTISCWHGCSLSIPQSSLKYGQKEWVACFVHSWVASDPLRVETQDETNSVYLAHYTVIYQWN